MPPKSKSPKVKPDWILCPQSGLLYHSTDSATHATWLSSSGYTTTTPSHPHIVTDRLISTINLVAPSSLSLSLPPQVLYSSVFISPFVAKQCGLGQASLVLVKVDTTQLVLTMFTSPDLPPTQISCTPHSWLASVAKTDQQVSVEMFTGEVAMCKEVEVMLMRTTEEESDSELVDTESDKFRTAVKFHLTGLVIKTNCELPFMFFGVRLVLKLRVSMRLKTRDLSSVMDKLTLETDLPTSPNLNTSDLDTSHSTPPHLSSTAVTSTPHKTVSSLSTTSSTFHRISMSTKLVFPDLSPNVNITQQSQFVGGLDREIETITSSLRMVLGQGSKGRRVLTGLLLFGPPGTGKTLLAQHLPELLGVRMVSIAGPELYSKFYGETEAQLRAKFEEASKVAPSILFIDELDSLAPKRENGGSDQERRVVASMVTLLDRLHSIRSQVVVVAATSRLDGVDPSLRRPGRLDMEVEIGVPGVKQRKQILSGMLEEQEDGHNLVQEEVDKLAGDTHGFVGADVQALVSLATMVAREEGKCLSMEHFMLVRSKVKPSAMREVMVEVPQVTWSDIGGLDELKLKLRQAVEWPIKHPEVFTRMGISAPRGLLMYGPPGCSKTMIAKALANESGLNFLSIKGPELFSKWVGESERAVREVFRKARQVKPSIVFFDEIDAIGGARGGGGGGGKVGDRVLAQLLTEMDGVEGLVGVTVVAATNRPDMMDQALLRPGRLDRVVYVPLPDMETRRKVLDVHTRSIPLCSSVDLNMVAARTEGYSGAEVAAVCNEAALAALEESVTANVVTETHFETALSNLKPRISAELFSVYDKFQADHCSKTV
eukprot:TRINITY_DN41968_c0_g1_i1.p1 TRINITY_DN41968_c0_g1~~TRINITY_DN41968_c0_g1_i1.p1  ORF type:complete len:827 (-),score=300.90 TRINITY_DN41968_c0_g1_i1:33-2513(-)